MLDDLKRQAEIDAFYGKSMDWPHAVALIAFVFIAAWALDRIERRAAINAAPQANSVVKAVGGRHHVENEAQAGMSVRVPDGLPADAAPLSHPLRGDHCDITITQRSAGPWSPEKCAMGERK